MPTNLPTITARKIRTAIANPYLVWNLILVSMIGFPLAILARLLRPVIRIRFGEIRSYRIGELIAHCDLYLCQKARWPNARCLDFFYTTAAASNQMLLDLFKQRLCIGPVARWAGEANARLPGHEEHTVKLFAHYRDGLHIGQPPPIKLPDDMRADGDEWLASFGIAPDQPIALIANRDPAYLDIQHPNRDWSYHDYRDFAIETLIPMAEMLANRGYAVVRMGAQVASPLTTDNSQIIDYPNIGRTEARDVYLAARCRFFLGPNSGMILLGHMFRKPIGHLNSVPFLTVIDQMTSDGRDLWLPKLYWSVTDNRPMTFSEISLSGAGLFNRSEQFQDAGIELIDNTPEEIADFALEMEALESGQRVLGDEDRKLYARFWHAVPAGHSRNNKPQVSLSFLQRHADLL